eukprot:TRINITY_DN4520_c0_g4_i1.p1 TRINITY_DN4520_c0_g4~~TRINITY_DN4520_c0_g4_i1.p1  ORF type:complete len:220 (+),score=37.57 TRINITY_DN4520_c0_g4_i1:42-701(+)
MFPCSHGKHARTYGMPYHVLLESVIPLECQKAHQKADETTEDDKPSKVTGVQWLQHVIPCADIGALPSLPRFKTSIQQDIKTSSACHQDIHPAGESSEPPSPSPGTSADIKTFIHQGNLMSLNADQEGHKKDDDDDCSSCSSWSSWSSSTSGSSSGNGPKGYDHAFQILDVDAHPITHVEGLWGMAPRPSRIPRAMVCLKGTIWEKFPANVPASRRLSL